MFWRKRGYYGTWYLTDIPRVYVHRPNYGSIGEGEIGIVRGPRGEAERRLSMLCMRAREPQKRLKATGSALVGGNFWGGSSLVVEPRGGNLRDEATRVTVSDRISRAT